PARGRCGVPRLWRGWRLPGRGDALETRRAQVQIVLRERNLDAVLAQRGEDPEVEVALDLVLTAWVADPYQQLELEGARSEPAQPDRRPRIAQNRGMARCRREQHAPHRVHVGAVRDPDRHVDPAA